MAYGLSMTAEQWNRRAVPSEEELADVINDVRIQIENSEITPSHIVNMAIARAIRAYLEGER